MIGQTLSHFTITAKLGEGGMGEVYRAEDTKLGREVAIKVLPELLTADPERLARFEREAKVLASLNHPNIAGIHQIEEADGQQLLVMELVEGEDLADRMAQGAIPVEEAVGIAHQIAQGLEAAHERGVVHRDLKPANVKLTPDGQVKILDFGLAKAHEAAEEASPDMTRSPTLTAQMTQAGVILGTAAYMSPEQARGQEADPRADIWALGVVVYEMLTGTRLFAEATVSDTLAAVLRAEIDWDALPGGTPPSLRRLLRRCLEREAKQRYHAAADVRIDLASALTEEDAGPAEITEVATKQARLPWVVAAGAVAVALVLWAQSFRAPDEADTLGSGSRAIASLVPPVGTDLYLGDSGLGFSPDGTRVAFVARDESGQAAIWIHSIVRGSAERIPRTEEAAAPFWSPDGRSIGFNQDGQIRTLELESGLVETLAPQAFADGATWGSSGEVVFGTNDTGQPIAAVKSTGGTIRPVTEPPAANTHYFGPDFLPDGQHFIFHARRYGSEEQIGQIRLGSLDGSPSRHLFDSQSTARYVDPGFIVWWHQGNLRARAFDATRLEWVGEPVAIASNVQFDPRSGFAVADVSDTGRLVYQTGGRVAGNQLAWFGRGGEALGTLGEAGSLYSPRLSPDGSRIALDISGDSNQGDIWILDVERESGTRVTVWPEDESYPAWSPDGTELMFGATRGSNFEIFRVDAGGSAEPELVVDSPDFDVIPRAWSRDGRTVLFLGGGGRGDLWELTVESGETRPVIETEFSVNDASISPDGRWLAYDSDETGRREVYLATYPDVSRRVRVSTEGGSGPVWSGDGRELFFSSPDLDAIFGISVMFDDDQPVFGEPEQLIRVDMKVHSQRQFDTLDGERFLVNTDLNTGARTPLTLVLNWTEGL